ALDDARRPSRRRHGAVVLGLRWTAGLLRRRSGRLAAQAGGVALAVGLLACLGVFLASAKGTMTRRAAATVAVDWQVEAQPGADPAAVLAATRSTVGVEAVRPVGFADTTGLQAAAGGTTQSTGPGVVVGLPLDYAT